MGKCRCLGESSLAVFNFLDLVFGCVLLTASLVAHEKVTSFDDACCSVAHPVSVRSSNV